MGCGHEEAVLGGMLDSLPQPFLRLQHMLALPYPGHWVNLPPLFPFVCTGIMQQFGALVVVF